MDRLENMLFAVFNITNDLPKNLWSIEWCGMNLFSFLLEFVQQITVIKRASQGHPSNFDQKQCNFDAVYVV